jgi:antirestriction protein
MTVTVDLTADTIDIRDIIERIEELANDLTTYSAEAFAHPELVEEHAALCAIMAELAGNGGDEQWEGDWYPLTLIRESYFKDYAQELAEDIGAVHKNTTWPHYCIDWDFAARELKMDYSAVNIDGATYLYR